jgi:hypothetical protein
MDWMLKMAWPVLGGKICAFLLWGDGAPWIVLLVLAICAIAVVFRPRLLWGSLALIGLVLVLGGLGLVESLFSQQTPTAGGTEKGASELDPSAETNWPDVALQILAQEREFLEKTLAEERARREELEQQLAEVEARTPPADQSHAETSSIAFPREFPEKPDAGEPGIYDRAGRTRSGYSGGAVPLTLQRAWTANPEGQRFLAPPLVSGDAVYAAGTSMESAAARGFVHAFDSASGKELWATGEFKDTEIGLTRPFQAITASPALSVDGRVLVVGQGLDQDRNGSLVGLNAADGSTLWAISTSLHITGGPVIEGDRFIAGTGAVEGVDGQAVDLFGEIICARVSDGQVSWRYPVIDPECSPLLFHEIAYVGSGANGQAVLALRTESDGELARNGLAREIWHAYMPGPVVGAIAMHEDSLLVVCSFPESPLVDSGNGTTVVALERRTGMVLWSRRESAGCANALAVVGDVGLLALRNGEVVGLDLSEKGSRLHCDR